MDVLKSVGIVAAFKGFLIFLLYGFITTAVIAGAYGLESDLPKSVVATLEGPISIYTFGWLSIVGLVLLAIVTKLGKKDCDFIINRPKRIFWVALPICEAAIALGIVIGGTLLGVAISSHILIAATLTSTKIYPQFYALAAFMFLITYPVGYFTIALIDTKKTVFFWLNVSALVYAAFIVATLYFTLPVKDASLAGLQAVILIAGYAFLSHSRPVITSQASGTPKNGAPS
ncbi:Flp pilus assembly pilin Flp [Zhongshania antarctica]|uniref:Flp pilus assembly pilin Flp n=1 Tax=Zhongshania antarctica TaxID=641702 RepID=A0A840R2E5_9GAMM|nr:hypothetical protein [Zhongshania antarctica]MBB5186640.1 Flp pilus assembly pilin Flp [Zhongshania antarctica]